MENKNDLPKVTWKPRVGNVEIFMRRSRILESESTRGPFTLKTAAQGWSIPSVTFVLWYCFFITQIKCFLACTGPPVTCGKQEEGAVNSLLNSQSYHVLDHTSVSAVQPGLGVSGLLVTNEFMCLEAYGLDIWSQSKGARYFKLATILLTLTGLLCSHSNTLDEKFLMFQTIPSSGLHFIIQSPAKQLQSFCVTLWPWG